MGDLIYKAESFEIIGRCMDVHNHLGGGFSEIVYKDALEYEFEKEGIPCEREKEYTVAYKDVILSHKFYADFVVFDKIILEVKSTSCLLDEHIAQTINYLAVSKNKLGLLVNFRRDKLEYKRIVL